MTATPTTTSWNQQKKTLVPAAVIGTVLEWYDMFVYAQAAALIFAQLFFPDFSAFAGSLAALATFGVGYVARPLGAIIFGHIGDKLGRKVALSSTLLLMGGATTLIGVLPTFAVVGVLAPILLVLLRLLQGVGAGAEYSGSFVMVAEAAPANRRGLWAAMPGVGVYGGIILASAVGLTVFQMPAEQLYSWGWRIPFLVSFALIIVGLVMRFRMAETRVFTELKKQAAVRKLPFVAVFRQAPTRLFLAMGLTAPIAFNAYVASTYALTYGVEHGVTQSGVLVGTLLGAATAFVLVPVIGRLSDRFGRRPVFITLAAIAAICVVPYFLLLNTGEDVPYWLAQMLIIAPFTQGLTGAQAAFLAELFEPEVRYTGVALSREICTAVVSSVAPVLALTLVTAAGGEPWVLAGAMAGFSLLGVVCAVLLPETHGIDMRSSAAESAIGLHHHDTAAEPAHTIAPVGE